MRCDMSDSQFLAFVDLAHPSMCQARDLATAGHTRRACLAAAKALFASPFKHPVDETEIPALARAIQERVPQQVQHLVRLADNYLLVKPPPKGLLCGANREEEQGLYRSCCQTWKRRGDGVHALARLYHLTQNRKYRDGAVLAMRQIVRSMPHLPDGERAGAFSWHPYGDVGSHEPGHIAEKICHSLPYLRTDLSAVEALLFAKALLAMAEFNYRTCRYDVPHNITLHMLTGSLLVGLCFPAFKGAAEWVQTIQRRLETDFTSRAFVTPDGYFGEGFGYQNVNHNLVQVCLRYLLSAGRKVSPRLRRTCEQSFEFGASIVRPDGNVPLLGDCHSQMTHEHHIQQHEMLHYAATFFRRADFKAAAGSPYGETPLEYNLWLMGLKGLTWWDSVPPAERAKRQASPHDCRASGLQVLGLGEGLAAHSGLFACAATHNHAHSDFGSIDLYGLGRPLLTDSSVTSYAEDSYRSERAHNTVVPVRRTPLGPRLDRPDHVKTLFVVQQPKIQAACMEHDLYETHRIRRTVCLVNAAAVLGSRELASSTTDSQTPARGGDAASGKKGQSRRVRPTEGLAAFWLVIDRVERRSPYPGRPEPHEFLETYFHFNAPQTRLGCDPATLTCWSRHSPEGLTLLRYPSTDTGFREKPERVRLAQYLQVHEDVSSDANLQVTAVLPSLPQYIMDMRIFQGFTGEYLGRVKRPSMAYRWRGQLPFDAAYVLVPFRGVRNAPYAQVAGHWSPTGDLDVSVQLPQGSVRFKAEGLGRRLPKPVFTVRAG
jgi:hypothetical protein